MQFCFPRFLKKTEHYRKNPRNWGEGIPRISKHPGDGSSPNDQPLVSIITVVKNGARTLLRTLESVKAQTYRNIEYIIIDGGSSDATIELLKRHSGDICYWKSEPDSGIGEAFNKGILKSRGEVISFLNSDDWYEPQAVAMAVEALRTRSSGIAHGLMVLHDSRGNSILYDGNHTLLPFFNSVNHPTVFARRECFQNNGLFRGDFKISVDYEWLLRYYTQGGTFTRINMALSHMSSGGACTRSFEMVAAENFLIRDRYGMSPMQNWLLYMWQILQKGLRNGSEGIGVLPVLGALRRRFFSLCRGIGSSMSFRNRDLGAENQQKPAIAVSRQIIYQAENQ